MGAVKPKSKSKVKQPKTVPPSDPVPTAAPWRMTQNGLKRRLTPLCYLWVGWDITYGKGFKYGGDLIGRTESIFPTDKEAAAAADAAAKAEVERIVTALGGKVTWSGG